MAGETFSRREKIRKDLNPCYLEYYDELCRNLSKEWQPISGMRTFKEQAALYDIGRSKDGNPPIGKIVTNAGPGYSPHNYGCATDWCLFDFDGQPIWEHQQWHEYAVAVDKAGLRWGGDFKTFKDKPHNELNLRIPWGKLSDIYIEHGMQEANKIILLNIIQKGGIDGIIKG